MRWTDEKDAEIERRIANGESLGKIARALSVSKNAIVGRWQRIKARKVKEAQAMMGYTVTRKKPGPPKRSMKSAARLAQALAVEEPPRRAPARFRSPVQDEWPLTMCAELPLSLDREYERVN